MITIQPTELDQSSPPPKVKRQVFIDASALKGSSCFRHFWWNTFEGWRGQMMKEHKMAYGSAIHLFLEDFYKCIPIKDCVERAVEYYRPFNDSLDMSPYEFRTTNNLIKTCKSYSDRWLRNKVGEGEKINLNPYDFQPHIDQTGKQLVEYKFSIPIWANEDFELILCGTIDLICSYNGYKTLLVDHKTTGIAVSKVQEFMDQYDFDIQTMLYSKVWKEANGLDFYPPVLINGIFCKKPSVKAEKENFFDGVSLERSCVIEYSLEKMEEFNIYLAKALERVVAELEYESHESADSDCLKKEYNMAACKSVFGHCQYFDVCKLQPQYQKAKLETAYERKQYNPLKFRD